MNLRESVRAALRFEEVRPTPYTVWYDSRASQALDAHYGDHDWAGKIRDHILRITIDWRPKNSAGDEFYTDLHGTRWRAGSIPHIVQPALSEPSLDGFTVPSYRPYLHQGDPPVEYWGCKRSMSFDRAREELAEAGDVFTVVDYGPGVLESAWMIRGYEGFFMDLAADPGFARDLLEMLLERHLELIDELVTLPCDALMITDDFGDQRGVTVGPDRWRELIKPILAPQYARIREGGKTAFHHSCGSVYDIVGDLIESGLQVLQSVQPESMPVYEMKRRYGRNIAFWGGFGVQELLPFGTPEEIRVEARRLKRKMGAGGGYVFSTAKHITGDVPVENIAAIVEESVAEDA